MTGPWPILRLIDAIDWSRPCPLLAEIEDARKLAAERKAKEAAAKAKPKEDLKTWFGKAG